MAEGFGKYVGTGTVRTKELFRRIEREGVSDPEDIMLIIMDIFKEEVLYPEPGKPTSIDCLYFLREMGVQRYEFSLETIKTIHLGRSCRKTSCCKVQ